MEVVDTLRKGEEEPWRVLEFYSGIGGMRYSIIKAGVKATMVEAFDINDKANDVYQHNFSRRPYQGNIQSLTAAELDKYKAHAWLLSPPCQPYTRQGLQKDSGDARASSFLKILDLVPHMSSPPLMLFVENVVGFETSDTHNQMMEIFRSIGFTTQEYILTPLQFGVPYSRPRYFCLAKKEPLSFQNPHVNNQLLWTPGPLMENDSTTWIDDHSQSHGRWDEWLESCKTVESFLEFSTCKYQPEAAKSEIRHNNDASPKFSQTLEKCSEEENCLEKCSEEENCSSNSYLNKYTVPLSLIERWGSAMDIVYPHSKRCCCFTKSYYRYVKGTGSLLASREPQKDTKSLLKEQGLRYFTPREVANLHSLPKDFHFPQHISLKQQYALLGNSLSIAVVAPLLRYLFTEPSLIMQKEIIEPEFN